MERPKGNGPKTGILQPYVSSSLDWGRHTEANKSPQITNSDNGQFHVRSHVSTSKILIIDLFVPADVRHKCVEKP